jgi:hypothetical protein
VGRAAALAAERVGGPQDDRQAQLARRGAARLHVRHHPVLGHGEAGGPHGVAEHLAVLGAPDRLDVGTDQLHAVALEHARGGQLDGQVERRLPAEGRQQRVGALGRDHGLDRLPVEGLHVGAVGDRGVGHDRGRVRVDQHHPVALGGQRARALGARVVELAGLADHDRPAAEDQDGVEVVAARHQSSSPPIAATNSRNM